MKVTTADLQFPIPVLYVDHDDTSGSNEECVNVRVAVGECSIDQRYETPIDERGDQLRKQSLAGGAGLPMPGLAISSLGSGP